MSELSPEKLALLKQAVEVQERMLAGCVKIFTELSKGPSGSFVVSVADEAIKALNENAAILEAMVDGLTETKH